jgi:hypothetical protein
VFQELYHLYISQYRGSRLYDFISPIC